MTNDNTKSKLKSYFESGDVPSEAQFSELIDHALNASSIDTGTLDNVHLPAQIDLTPLGAGSQVTAQNFIGSGAMLTDLNADSISTGTLHNDHLPSSISVTAISADTFTGDFTGDGAGLTALNADEITSGTLINDHLPATINVTTVSADTFTGDFTGDGAGLTALNADEISIGTINNERLSVASDIETGIVRLATTEEAKLGVANNVVITPDTLASTIILEHLFEFKEDTGQVITVSDIPNGKILALFQ